MNIEAAKYICLNAYTRCMRKLGKDALSPIGLDIRQRGIVSCDSGFLLLISVYCSPSCLYYRPSVFDNKDNKIYAKIAFYAIARRL